MNGMVPYVDFADSKGPLLWLIYGIGYLLNSHSYVGVFWVSCVFYAVSFTFAYKISRLYLSRRASVIVLALLPAVLLYRGLHYEVRAEDYCNTFLFVSLYCLCRVQQGVDKRQLFKYAFITGACMTCCLLIKFSIFFMLGSIALVILFISLRNKTLHGLWGGLLGIVVPAVPFLVYFIVQGNLEAFIFEYFINTTSTVNLAGQTFFSNLLEVKKIRLLLLLGTIFFIYRYKNPGILFCLIVFNLLLAVYVLRYYYNILLPFGIFMLIAIMGFVESKIRFSKRVVIPLALVCILCSTAKSIHYDKLSAGSVFEKSNKYRQSYYDVSQLMATVKNPKVMFFWYDEGVGVLADALPACKYWTQQNAATPAMIEERRRAIQKRKPDFLVMEDYYYDNTVKQYNLTPAELRRLGYVRCGNVTGENPGLVLYAYCKKELYCKLPPVKLRNIDLLLKRDILCGNSETK